MAQVPLGQGHLARSNTCDALVLERASPAAAGEVLARFTEQYLCYWIMLVILLIFYAKIGNYRGKNAHHWKMDSLVF